MPQHGFLSVKRGPAEIHFWLADTPEAARAVGIMSSCYIRVKNVALLFEELQKRATKFRYPAREKTVGNA